MFTIALCFVISYLTAQAGLSLALGSFLAGLIISESDYNHQATSTILPFRAFFSSFFYVSIGMLMDVYFFLDHFFIIIGVSILVFVLKSTIALCAALVLKYNIRTSILTGLILFQIGEFAIGFCTEFSDDLHQHRIIPFDVMVPEIFISDARSFLEKIHGLIAETKPSKISVDHYISDALDLCQ